MHNYKGSLIKSYEKHVQVAIVYCILVTHFVKAQPFLKEKMW